ncbi:MAG: hypothetical protein ACE5IR_24445 [bacterium]
MHNENITSSTSEKVESQTTEMPDEIMAIRQIKNEVAKRLLQYWLADDSGYDEKVWQNVKKAIEENRLSFRTKFDE